MSKEESTLKNGGNLAVKVQYFCLYDCAQSQVDLIVHLLNFPTDLI